MLLNLTHKKNKTGKLRASPLNVTNRKTRCSHPNETAEIQSDPNPEVQIGILVFTSRSLEIHKSRVQIPNSGTVVEFVPLTPSLTPLFTKVRN